jgi:hypothetical protein
MEAINFNEIKNYWGDDYILSSPDLIAVKYGLKKVARISYGSEDEYKRIKDDSKKHDLEFILSDEKLFEQFNLYVSRDKELAELAKRVDPSFKIINGGKQFNQVTNEVKEFSRLIGYPECCVNEYISNVLNCAKITEIKAFKKLPLKIKFIFNNVLNGVSNFFLSFHFPCSFNCSRTADYQAKILEKIQRLSPAFARQLIYHLKHPYLIFLDPSLNSAYASWDKRRGVIFNGRLGNNNLIYDKVLFFKTDYPDYKNDNAVHNLNSILNNIKCGDNIKIGENGFAVYTGHAKICDFINQDSLRAFWLNFV